ncbi:energy-coupling factor ABC transporter ATP-binding protein [Desulfohalovibrio reitneri]|uniref:energy-coupling factor ABC transporter ATP-binding protein n=1 Tax=Desulfohalovibrio reitneri TaxID=1307759 RepID=UPI0004A74B77|nr:ABC transporter ATP-binding protein [Desulfohalovibrio reitneri]
MSALLQLRSLTYRHPRAEGLLLDGVDLDLEEGERLGLLGANGSGKTTLLHLMVGLKRAGSGSVLLRGREMAAEKDFRELRREVNLLFQRSEDQLFSPTVLEDVAFGPLNLGLPPQEARERAEETLDRLGLPHLADRLSHTLSGGEMKLAALATVLSMRPRLLLLDEPSNDLDPRARDHLLEVLGGLDTGLVVVSHDYDFLARLVDTYAALEEGRLARRERPAVHHHPHAHPLGDHPHSHGDGTL